MRHDSSVLNALRATAVALVLFDHVLETVAPAPPYDWYMGRLGVLLFFVHTSCVLMMSMQRTPRQGLALAMHFYIRRAFRIYPLTVVTVAAVLVLNVPVVAWAPELPDRSFRTVIANLLIAQNLLGANPVSAPLWTLPLEIEMYVLLPFVFMWIGSVGSIRRASALWLASVLVAAVSIPTGLRLPLFAPCFFAGVLGFCVAQRQQAWLPYWLWPPALFALIAIYVGITQLGSEVHSWPAAWITCLLTGLLLPQFRDTISPLRVIPEWLAKYSFGIYLSHMIALWTAFRVASSQPWAVQWLLFVGVIVGVSAAVFHLIEAPMIRVGARAAEAVLAPAPLKSVA